MRIPKLCVTLSLLLTKGSNPRLVHYVLLTWIARSGPREVASRLGMRFGGRSSISSPLLWAPSAHYSHPMIATQRERCKIVRPAAPWMVREDSSAPKRRLSHVSLPCVEWLAAPKLSAVMPRCQLTI